MTPKSTSLSGQVPKYGTLIPNRVFVGGISGDVSICKNDFKYQCAQLFQWAWIGVFEIGSCDRLFQIFDQDSTLIRTEFEGFGEYPL